LFSDAIEKTGFDANLGFLIVEKEEKNSYLVWDGNHRFAAVQDINDRGGVKGKTIEKMPCLVFKGKFLFICKLFVS
jgi:hypothetical protein